MEDEVRERLEEVSAWRDLLSVSYSFGCPGKILCLSHLVQFVSCRHRYLLHGL